DCRWRSGAHGLACYRRRYHPGIRGQDGAGRSLDGCRACRWRSGGATRQGNGMRTAHHADGVTTYIYSQDIARTAANVVEVRQSVERIELMCRDILTALNLLTDLLPEANGDERSADEGGDSHL